MRLVMIPEADQPVMRQAYDNHPRKVPHMTSDRFLQGMEHRLFMECRDNPVREEIHSILDPSACSAFNRWIDYELTELVRERGFNEEQTLAIREILLQSAAEITIALFNDWHGELHAPRGSDDERNLRQSLRDESGLILLPEAIRTRLHPPANGETNGKTNGHEKKWDGRGNIAWTLRRMAHGRAVQSRTIYWGGEKVEAGDPNRETTIIPDPHNQVPYIRYGGAAVVPPYIPPTTSSEQQEPSPPPSAPDSGR